MEFERLAGFARFKRQWDSVRIARNVHCGLFTFGDSDLPYYLVCGPSDEEDCVVVKRGEVKVTRPLIVTAQNASPQFRDFFEDRDDQAMAQFVLARTARFPHVQFSNVVEFHQKVTDSVDEAVERLDGELDREDENQVAILTAPPGLGGIAVLRYCVERVAASAPDNITELKERGLLPESWHS
jgi:hypothetical protein